MVRVTLRPFHYATDTERLYAYMMKDENQKLFSHGFQISALPLFEQWITAKLASNEYHDFFMIDNAKGETIGFTFSYDFFAYDGHCKYTLCLFEEYQNRGYGMIAGLTMMDRLFTRYPLRRLFVSVFDYNERSLELNKKGGFEEVGVLPDYRFWGGEYVSLHILSMQRETFYKKHNRILNKLNSTNRKGE